MCDRTARRTRRPGPARPRRLGPLPDLSALQRDYTVVMGMVIFYAGLILLLNLIADLLSILLTPRARTAISS